MIYLKRLIALDSTVLSKAVTWGDNGSPLIHPPQGHAYSMGQRKNAKQAIVHKSFLFDQGTGPDSPRRLSHSRFWAQGLVGNHP